MLCIIASINLEFFYIIIKVGFNMNRKTFEQKSMGIGDVLDYTIEVFRSNFKSLSMLVLILYLPWTLLYSLIVGRFTGEQISYLTDYFMSAISGEDILLNSNYPYANPLSGIIVQLMSLLQYGYKITIELVFNVAVVKISYDYIKKGRKAEYSFKEIIKLIKSSFRYLPRMMGNAVLFVLIFYAAYIVAVIIIAIVIVTLSVTVIGSIASTGSMMENTIMTVIILVIIGVVVLLALFILIAYVMSRFILGAHTIVIEERSVADSLKRSFELTKGNKLHVLMACLFGVILFMVLGSLFSTLSYLTVAINEKLFVFLYTASQVASAFLIPLIMVFLTVLYVSVRNKKEGLDLEFKVNKLLEQQSKVNFNVQDESKPYVEFSSINGETDDV